jgi:uncharacterized protein YdeI (YjbR/CyaY-like superfamily)
MKSELWKSELALLRKIIQKTGLTSTTKWGGEVFTYKDRNVVSIGGFKAYFTIWFFDGVFLKDPHKVLTNAQEGKTKAMRHWRFFSKDAINEQWIIEYIEETKNNVDNGKVWKPEKSAAPEMPQLLRNALKKNKQLQTHFSKLTPYKQKEYIEYILSARQDATKLLRVEKIKPLIMQCMGLNEKYKK